MSLKVASWNIANAIGDEVTDMRFGKRLNAVADLIKSQNLDVIGLQELRQCLDETDNLLTPLDIAYRLAKQTGLEIANLFPLNPSKLAFSRLTLYNPNTVFPLNSFSEWTSNTPTKNSGWNDTKLARFGNGIQYTLFACVIDREGPTVDYDKTFLFANAHFPLQLQDKLYASNIVCKRISELANNTKTILCGDSNTFVGDGYDEQINILRNVFDEVSKDIEFTFLTFPHDKFAVDSGKLVYSKLDHMMAYPKESNFVSNVEVIDTVDKRESDHFMLVATVNL